MNIKKADTESIDLAVLRAQARRTALRRPWLEATCDLIVKETDLLENRGVIIAPRLDIAADIGMAVLEKVLENDVELDAPDTGVLKTLT